MVTYLLWYHYMAAIQKISNYQCHRFVTKCAVDKLTAVYINDLKYTADVAEQKRIH